MSMGLRLNYLIFTYEVVGSEAVQRLVETVNNCSLMDFIKAQHSPQRIVHLFRQLIAMLLEILQNLLTDNRIHTKECLLIFFATDPAARSVPLELFQPGQLTVAVGDVDQLQEFVLVEI